MVFGIGGGSLGTTVNDFLGLFDIKGGRIGMMIDGLTGNSMGVLQNMYDRALETATGDGTGPWQRAAGMSMMGMGIPPALAMPSPMSVFPTMAPMVAGGYAMPGMGYMGAMGMSPLAGLMNPGLQQAAMAQQMFGMNPFARATFESQMGGSLLGLGAGGLLMQGFAPGFSPLPGMAFNPVANLAFGSLASITYGGGLLTGGLGALAGGLLGGKMGALGGGLLGLVASPFLGFLGAGLGSVLRGFGMPFGLQSPLGGAGMGSWNPMAAPGMINNTNPIYESIHQGQVDMVLRDPALTVEDKVTLMIMLIMNKMDEDIERQAQYINSIQQQQSNKTGGKGAGKGFMGVGPGKGTPTSVGGANSPSIDVETMKLKRLIDKRSQMFDMLRQIIDKYNQTAKGIIDSIGR